MAQDKLNKKYFPLIWLLLIVAFYIRNVYSMYLTFSDLGQLSAGVARLYSVFYVAVTIVSEGPLPALFTFLIALVIYQIGFNRYARSISRRDFCYYTMLFVAPAKILTGFIEIFSILNPAVSYFTSQPISVLLLNVSLFVMVMAFFPKRYNFNPVEYNNCYKMWALIFMIAQGVIVMIESGAIFLLRAVLSTNPTVEILQLLEQYNIEGLLSTVGVAAQLTTIGVYVASLVTVIVVGANISKKAKAYRDPQTRDEWSQTHANPGYQVRRDDDSFSEFSGSPNSNNQNDDNSSFGEFDN